MRRVILSAALTVSLAAQDGASYAQFHAGIAAPGGGHLHNRATFGLGAGAWIMDPLGLDFRLVRTSLDPISGPGSGDRTYGLLSLNLNLRPGASGFWPYLALGLGYAHSGGNAGGPDSSRGLVPHGGLGLMAPLAEHLVVSLDWKAVRQARTAGSTLTDQLYTVGLGYRWGGKAKPTPTPAPAPEPPAPMPAAPVPAAPVPAAPKAVPELPPTPVPAAPMPAAPAPEPAPAPLAKKIVLGETVLHFPNNGATLGEAGLRAVREVADLLKAYPGNYTLLVTGHTSSLGPREHNLRLSQARARAIAEVLAQAGIPPERITISGKGPDQPVAENRTREGQSRNRRVEIEVRTPEAVEKVKTATATEDAAPVRKPKRD